MTHERSIEFTTNKLASARCPICRGQVSFVNLHKGAIHICECVCTGAGAFSRDKALKKWAKKVGIKE